MKSIARQLSTSLASALVLFGVLLVQGGVQAKTSDFEQAIDVKADRSEFNEKAGVQILSGNVEITQGTMLIKADSIEVTLKDNKLSTIEGQGSPIRFQQENDEGELIVGECQTILYEAENGRLTLKGSATLSEPKQNLRSDRIVFDSISQTVIAEGGKTGRVSITIQPPDQKQ
ncbi:MAG: lipopolysaccharide transport periplasmic protein LptA [Gammaproteobacteria bacterium]|nr:lipopolysaccharide transport periplasmic protein LptA [Gammaproteobacteria bacterium]